MTTRAGVPSSLLAWRELLSTYGPPPELVDDAHRALTPPGGDETSRTQALALLEQLDHRAARPELVRLAVWLATGPGPDRYPGKSAERARQLLPRLDVPAPVVAEVARLLSVLEEHDPAADDLDARVLCDVDLAVLGAPSAQYAEHVDRLRGTEQSLHEWRAQRRSTVRDLLGRDTVFTTPELRAAREARAQLNLAREAASLGVLPRTAARPHQRARTGPVPSPTTGRLA